MKQREYIPKFEWPPALAGMVTPLLILIFLTGCAGRNPMTIYRPNARTQLEERAYNALKVSDRLITEAEDSNEKGTLPEFMRPIVDGLIAIHELALTASEKYVAVIGAEGEEEQAQALVDLLVDLDALITKMFQRGAGP